MSNELFTVDSYFLADYPRTLFPMTTTSLLVQKFSAELKEFLYNKLLCDTSASSALYGPPLRTQGQLLGLAILPGIPRSTPAHAGTTSRLLHH